MIDWIDIKDQLPPVGEYVLTYGGWEIRMDKYWMTLDNGVIWFKGDRDNYNDEVTHWARIDLPE